jgi:sugar O-acyltransferase (sialic acid O-acetyltransferase NeuD family)
VSATAKPFLVFGAGGLAADVIDIIARRYAAPVAGLIVDCGVPPEDESPGILRWEDVEARADAFIAVNAMGRPARKNFIEKAERAGFAFVTLIDPSAQIFPSAVVEPGCVIGAGCIVAARAHIGPHVFLNRGVLIGHHTKIDSFVSVQAGARIGGRGHIGSEAEIGIGATVIDRITVGARTIVGAGAVVIRDCPADATMIGVPARAKQK